ncbi:putative olfactory receptor 2B8 [Discoglossus pictus]
MAWENVTTVTKFILLGLSSSPTLQIFLFFSFFLIYLVILFGNSLIITVTRMDPNLQTPMYFFLNNLSFLDICYSTSTVPRMLRDLLSSDKSISVQECATQLYISLSLGRTECILLTVMAYDRYVAICYPLHYTSIINKTVCIKTMAATWLCAFVLSIPEVVEAFNITFCGHNEINHFLCEMPEILSLGCGDVTIMLYMIFVDGVISLITPVCLIIISYIKIVIAILKMSSTDGQRKAFSTCVSHVIVVTLFYGSAIATYMKPKSNFDTDKMIAVFYLIITPTLNPLIYTLRNKEVKTALRKIRIPKTLFIQM